MASFGVRWFSRFLHSRRNLVAIVDNKRCSLLSFSGAIVQSRPVVIFRPPQFSLTSDQHFTVSSENMLSVQGHPFLRDLLMSCNMRTWTLGRSRYLCKSTHSSLSTMPHRALQEQFKMRIRIHGMCSLVQIPVLPQRVGHVLARLWQTLLLTFLWAVYFRNSRHY